MEPLLDLFLFQLNSLSSRQDGHWTAQKAYGEWIIQMIHHIAAAAAVTGTGHCKKKKQLNFGDSLKTIVI